MKKMLRVLESKMVDFSYHTSWWAVWGFFCSKIQIQKVSVIVCSEHITILKLYDTPVYVHILLCPSRIFRRTRVKAEAEAEIKQRNISHFATVIIWSSSVLVTHNLWRGNTRPQTANIPRLLHLLTCLAWLLARFPLTSWLVEWAGIKCNDNTAISRQRAKNVCFSDWLRTLSKHQFGTIFSLLQSHVGAVAAGPGPIFGPSGFHWNDTV